MSITQESDGPDVPDVRLTVAAVARRLGVAPGTLRTWDRRYGIGPSAREAGRHRRYSATDLAVLEVMRRLTVAGVSPAEAARAALAGASGQWPAAAGRAFVSLPAGEPAELAGGEPAGEVRGRGSGGRVLALPGLAPQTRGLARAAMALDGAACAVLLSDAVRRDGVAGMYETLLRPVLVAVGGRWDATGQGVEVEHLLSETAAGVLRRSMRRVRAPVNRRPVLLACAADDNHSLPMLVLAAALAERSVATRLLGAALPADALAAAVRRIGPSVVVIQAQLAATADPGLLSAVPGQRPPVRRLVAGAGWDPDTLPDGVGYLDSLDSAVRTICAEVC